jgi:hypothetical protein
MLRIDADKHHPQTARIWAEQMNRFGQLGQRQGTNIGTAGEAEIDQQPSAAEILVRYAFGILIDELKWTGSGIMGLPGRIKAPGVAGRQRQCPGEKPQAAHTARSHRPAR